MWTLNRFSKTVSALTFVICGGLLFSPAPFAQVDVGAGPEVNPVTLSWTAPTTNVDGSPLTDLAGYRVYQRTSGTSSFVLIAEPGPAETSLLVDSPTVAVGQTYDWVVRAIDTAGNESVDSNIATKLVEAMPDTVAPNPPSGVNAVNSVTVTTTTTTTISVTQH